MISWLLEKQSLGKNMLIILDRDGVINFDSDNYIKSPDEWIPIPGSIEAIALLTKAKYKMVIATNQAGVNRGKFSLETLQKIHQKMLTTIESSGGKIEKIYFCPHHPDENCDCRKPQPGMFYQIQRDFKIKSDDMIYVGDSLKDYEVAQKIGCTFFLVRTSNGIKTEKTLTPSSKVKIFDDLISFVNYFLKL
ncbi:MAG: D-glycero-beta-D-manno-heptose-1,7-bisphosphate 7-phosphatase [Gammaproteobacteria bacterium RIFCSPHIGHO2_12_FULL_36_30]|nr:MAG: D-glycero-beta-D-manno-heptose-1,7-bisphosphate 7-phosphatase [Gammaproteobacteria bacterium RIFCSPHIGHO2_12_FULL_36_30]